MEGVKYEGYTEAISSAQGQASCSGLQGEGKMRGCCVSRGHSQLPARACQPANPDPDATDSGPSNERAFHHAATLLSLDGTTRLLGWQGPCVPSSRPVGWAIGLAARHGPAGRPGCQADRLPPSRRAQAIPRSKRPCLPQGSPAPTSTSSPNSPLGSAPPGGAPSAAGLPRAESLPVPSGATGLGKAVDIDRLESDDGQGNAERLLSPRSRARDLSAPTDKQAGGRAVIEEIFENERLQVRGRAGWRAGGMAGGWDGGRAGWRAGECRRVMPRWFDPVSLAAAMGLPRCAASCGVHGAPFYCVSCCWSRSCPCPLS